MKHISGLVMAMLASAVSVISNARADTSFDGAWSVQITMDRGNCNPINRLTVDIHDGALQYSGDVSIQGRVVNGGAVRVRLTYGDHRASGSGRLTGTSGTGTWHGTGLASSCAGRWTAERAPNEH
jgi:2-methylaconitate cis-trans-isomerase PrpF